MLNLRKKALHENWRDLLPEVQLRIAMSSSTDPVILEEMGLQSPDSGIRAAIARNSYTLPDTLTKMHSQEIDPEVQRALTENINFPTMQESPAVSPLNGYWGPEGPPPGIAISVRLNMRKGRRKQIRMSVDLPLRPGEGITRQELFTLYDQINTGHYNEKLINEVFYGLLSGTESILESLQKQEHVQLFLPLYQKIFTNLQMAANKSPEEKFMEIDKITHLWHEGNPVVIHLLSDAPDISDEMSDEEADEVLLELDKLEKFVENLPGHTSIDAEEREGIPYTPYEKYTLKLNMKKKALEIGGETFLDALKFKDEPTSPFDAETAIPSLYQEAESFVVNYIWSGLQAQGIIGPDEANVIQTDVDKVQFSTASSLVHQLMEEGWFKFLEQSLNRELRADPQLQQKIFNAIQNAITEGVV